MAQTKRKRQTKHRGNAAGSVTSRGRTSRPTSTEARKSEAKLSARERKLNTKPTWESAFKRSVLITIVMLIFLLVSTRNVFVSIAVAIVATVVYVPLGYYMDLFMWRRRMAKRNRPTQPRA